MANSQPIPDLEQIKSYVAEKRLSSKNYRSHAAFAYWSEAHRYLAEVLKLKKKAEPYPIEYWNCAIIESSNVWDQLPDFDPVKKAYLKEAYEYNLKYLEFRKKAIRTEVVATPQSIKGWQQAILLV